MYIQLINHFNLSGDPPKYTLGPTYDNKVNPEFHRHHRTVELYYASWYIRQGMAEVTSGGKTYRAHTGQWVFFDPLCNRAHSLSGDPAFISIRFRISWQGLEYLPPLTGIRVVDGEGKSELLTAAEALCEANHQEPALASAEYFHREAMFYQWLEHWRRERGALGLSTLALSDPRVLGIIETLSKRITIQPIDYPELQRAVGLSRAQINRVFHQETGLTPRQWMVARCLSEAQRQIRHGAFSLKEIAASLGFFDASHFTRWHRRQTGQSPTAWREQQAV
ncbi:helix-turn-helix domain-containing protein [Cerasicoccus frondis]|uniref:helix-turn-helix domain-containing protein n=1 Tax=Cerasicoccus frondis TaxID=490090 RepID=UPI002852D632|nr:AraC family transcriptional regulator [Cerasicoccus frondis]